MSELPTNGGGIAEDLAVAGLALLLISVVVLLGLFVGWLVGF